MARPVFNVLHLSQRVELKINHEHQVSADNVLDALESLTWSKWDEHPVRGRRLIVEGLSGSRKLVVVLCPHDVPLGEWRLGTAYEP